jgi:hypothetical protein
VGERWNECKLISRSERQKNFLNTRRIPPMSSGGGGICPSPLILGEGFHGCDFQTEGQCGNRWKAELRGQRKPVFER